MPPSGKMIEDDGDEGVLHQHDASPCEKEPEHEIVMNGSEVSSATAKTISSSSSSSNGIVASEVKVEVKVDDEVNVISNSLIPLSLLIMIPIAVTSLLSSTQALQSPTLAWISSELQNLSLMEVSVYVVALLFIVVLAGMVLPDNMLVYKGYGRGLFFKVLYSVMILYNVLLTVLYLYPNRSEARDKVFAIFFKDIGSLDVYQENVNEAITHVMKSCAINSTTLYRQIFVAPWFWCHIFGWTVKTFIFRDLFMCLFAGAMFEIWEVSLGYVVPEFEECWWDSLFLDYLMGNLGGILLGCFLLKYFNLECYNWSGCMPRNNDTSTTTSIEKPNTTTSNDSNNCTSFPLHLFSPFTSSDYIYDVFYNPTKLMWYCFTCFFMCLAELNIFNMVNTMGTPHGSAYCAFRMFAVTLLGLPLGYEFYRLTQGKIKGLGIAFFLMLWMNLLELMVTYKFFPPHMQVAVDNTNNPFKMPTVIASSHAISLSLFSLWVVLRYYVIKYDTTNENSENRYNILIEDMDTEGTKIVNRIVQQEKQNQQKKLPATSWYKNFAQLPGNLQRQVICVEGVNVFLLLSALPQLFLLYNGWKWD